MDKPIAERLVNYFDRAYDIATGTTRRQRVDAAEKHAAETWERNRKRHVGARQIARARRQIASGFLREENGLVVEATWR